MNPKEIPTTQSPIAIKWSFPYLTFSTIRERMTADGIEKSSMIITEVRVVCEKASSTMKVVKKTGFNLLNTVAYESTKEHKKSFQMEIWLYLPFWVLFVCQK